MIRHAVITLLGVATLALATTSLHAEGPMGDMRAKQQERQTMHEQLRKDMRQMEDKQRQEQRDMEDRHDKERKTLHEKHDQERNAMRQKMSPR